MRDLPGVGRNMHVRLAAHSIDTVKTLWERSADDLARAWGGIGGRQFWRNLHGEDVVEKPTQRRSISHSHVLPPELRTAEGAYAVLVRLVHKAAARMRNLGIRRPAYQPACATHRSHLVGKPRRHRRCRQRHANADRSGQPALEPPGRKGHPKKVGIALFDLEQVRNLTLPLASPSTPGGWNWPAPWTTSTADSAGRCSISGEMHGTRGRAETRPSRLIVCRMRTGK